MRLFPRALLAASLLLAATAALAQAGAYPNKPIRFIVPFPAAGPTDAYARLVGKMLADDLGQPVLIDNRAGATGLIGSNLVREAPADGYTLLYTSNSAHVIGPLLQKPHSFDPVADFTPIIEPLRYPMYLITSAKLPVKNFKEFIALAKAQPGKLTYSSVGIGSGGHLACELLNSAAGLSTLHVPYKGAAPAQAALIAGETDFMCDSVGYSQPMVAAGKLNGLALTSLKRSPVVPDVPTMAEEGVKGVDAYIWQGVFGPKGLPVAVRDKLAAAIKKIMDSPEMRERVTRDGNEVVAEPPAQFAKSINAEKAVWEKIIADKNIKAE
ncbi:MAG: tripartite tricarboxylate transporter substrate binding protein [Pseudomonadota bacterium]